MAFKIHCLVILPDNDVFHDPLNMIFIDNCTGSGLYAWTL